MSAPHRETGGSSPSVPRIEGRYAVLAILALAIALAAVAIVYVYHQQRRPNDFWGTDTAVLIVRAPQAAALRLVEAESTGSQETVAGAEILQVGEMRMHVLERVDVSHAGGFTYVRRSLMTDAAFDWSASPTSEPDWQYALEFRDGTAQATVLIALDDAMIGRLGDETRASITPAVEALRVFLEVQFDVSEALSK